MSGRIVKWDGTCTDIDGQMRAEEALRASESRLKAIIEKSWESVSLADRRGTPLHVSPATSRLLGHPTREVAEGHTGRLALLLSDVVMPGRLGGRQLAERVPDLHPETMVLFASGYTDDAVGRHGILQEETHFLQKPFSTLALVRKVREVLDSPSRDAGKGGVG